MGGLISDNYLPTNHVQINPSLTADPKVWLDIQCIGASAFLLNNYVYAPNSNILGISNIERLEADTNIQKVRMYSNAQIIGPSATIAIGRNTIGIHSLFRAYQNLNNIPKIFEQNTDLEFSEGAFNMNNARLKYMSWAQFGASYSRLISAKGHHIWQGGILLNYLMGFGQASIVANSSTFENSNNMQFFYDMDAKYAVTEHIFGSGTGFSGNIGFTYKYMKENVDHYIPHSKKSGCRKPNYYYRVGASLIDLGYIKYKEGYEYGTFTNTISVEQTEEVLNGQQSLNITNENTSYLPSAISVQYDQNIGYGFYAGGVLVQKLSSAKGYNVERSNLIFGQIRYERKWLCIGLPLSFVDYSMYQVGLWLRLWHINIGTDHIVPIFFNSKLKGANAYVSIHLPIHKAPFCKSYSESGNRKLDSCPTW